MIPASTNFVKLHVSSLNDIKVLNITECCECKCVKSLEGSESRIRSKIIEKN